LTHRFLKGNIATGDNVYNITLVVAMDRNRAIGVDNKIPWRLPKEQQHFKKNTVGKIVVMGRKTYESLPQSVRPLRERTNVILTKDPSYSEEGCVVVHDVAQVLEMAKHKQEVMIIGGEEIYKIFLPFAHKLLVTIVDTEVHNANKFFPEIGEGWVEFVLGKESPDENNPLPFSIFEYHRTRPRMSK